MGNISTDDLDTVKQQRKHMLICGIIFLICLAVGFVATFVMTVPIYRDHRIAQNTSLPIIEAEVTGINEGAGGFVIYFRWEENGTLREGRSRRLYTRQTATRLYQEGIKPIRVQGGRAIDINFRSHFASLHIFGIILAILSFGLSILFGYYTVIQARAFAIKNGILRKGIDSEGAFIREIPKKSFYLIEFSFNDQQGSFRKTRGLVPYTLGAVIAAKHLKKFPIKVKGKNAMILLDPLNKFLENNPNIVEKEAAALNCDVSAISSGVNLHLEIDIDNKEENKPRANICTRCGGKKDQDEGTLFCPYCGTKYS